MRLLGRERTQGGRKVGHDLHAGWEVQRKGYRATKEHRVRDMGLVMRPT